MIASQKLQEFFKLYEPIWLLNFLSFTFKKTYCKTYSDCGLYIWLGGDRKEFDTNLQMDHNSPMFVIQQEGSVYIVIFLNNTEDEVIHKFSNYTELKAFL